MENNKISKVNQILKEKYDEMVEFYNNEGYSRSETIAKVNSLLEEGFELASLLNMQRKYPEYLKFDVKNNLDGLRNLKKYGYTEEEIKKLVINNPILFILSERKSKAILGNPLSEENNIKANYAKLLYNAALETYKMMRELELEVGYYTTGALNIADYFHLDAGLLFGLPRNYPQLFNEMINKLVRYGYSKPAALYITSMCPKTLNFFDKYKQGEVKLPENIRLFEALSYSKEDIIKMTKLYPSILKTSKEDIRDTLRYFHEEGFKKDEIKLITKTNPNIYDKIKAVKIVENIFLDDNPKLIEELRYLPKNIEKDYNKTYCRYQYLKENGYKIDNDNFKLLFGTDHDFVMKYGMTDNLLADKYDPYNQTKKSFSKLMQPSKLSKRVK